MTLLPLLMMQGRSWWPSLLTLINSITTDKIAEEAEC